MGNKIQISVIIPVYNGERYLAEAIQSVLDQNYPSLEVIVVDDGSTDESACTAKSFGPSIRYYCQPNSGQAAASNHGIGMADGDYFTFLDADDLWARDRIHLQTAAFDDHPDVDIVSGYVKQFFSPELDENVKKRVRCLIDPIPGQIISAMLIKREAFFRVGLFETKWEIGEEMSWYLRAKEMELQMLMLPDLVLLKRIHECNKGITKRHLISQRAQILKAALDRRRKLKSDYG